MRYLSAEGLIKIHDYIIKVLGGEPGILNRGLVEAASLRPRTVVYGYEAFKDVVAKAASLAFAIITWHPFVDGNKRTAVFSMSMMTGLNDITFAFPPYLVKYCILVASLKIDERKFVELVTPMCARPRILAGMKKFRYESWPLFVVNTLYRIPVTRSRVQNILLDWLAAGDPVTLQKTLREWRNLVAHEYPREDVQLELDPEQDIVEE